MKLAIYHWNNIFIERLYTAPVKLFISLPSSSSHEKLQFSYCQGLSTKRFLGETIGQRLDKTVEKFPDREAYVCCEDNERATFAKFQEEVF